MEEHEQVTETDATATDGGTGRRALLTKVGVATAVAAVAGLAASRPAAAANGDTVFVGQTVSGTSTTLFNGGTTLRVTNGTSVGGASIYGTTIATQGIGVRGESSGTEGNGVRGEASATDGVGVYGRSTSTAGGTGVIGESTTGTGVRGIGTTIDLHAAGTGKVLLAGTGVANPPTTGTIGTIARDSAGNLWFAVATNTWRKLAGPAGSGAFHAITPVRVYDSRAALPTPGVLAPNLSRVVSVKDGRNAAGVVTAADVVPAGATAISFNLTVTAATGPNYLSVAPGDAASTGVSTLNFPAGADLANGGIVKLDTSRQIKVFCGDQTGSTHFIVDITGYYL